jgi:three-Cys-motif partner protein
MEVAKCLKKTGQCTEEGICTFYKSKQDGLNLRCVGEWSKGKINHFRDYAQMFSTGMKNLWRNRFYIDLFAGPGRCIIQNSLEEIDGSPLHALNVPDKFSGYFFVDKNPDCVDSLKKRTKSLEETIKIFERDCNAVIDKIVEGIPTDSLSLIIIDPASLQFKFNSFEKLSKLRGDLIVNYPVGPVSRAVSSVISSKSDSSKLDQFHPGWRKIVAQKSWGNSQQQNIRDLIDDYVKKICNLGYSSEKLDNLLAFKNSRNAIMYFLIAFSKNDRGIEFWRKAKQNLEKKSRQPKLL